MNLRPPSEWASRPDLERAAWLAVLLGRLYAAVARNAQAWLVGFVQQRVPANPGAPLASLPRVQDALGDMAMLLLANRTPLNAAASAADSGVPWSAAGSGLLKVAVTCNAVAVVEPALRQSGNHGLMCCAAGCTRRKTTLWC